MFDNRHIDRIRHRFVSIRTWVKMIARLVAVPKLERMSRITYGCIEVENPIESSACSNPLIHRLAHGFPVGAEVIGSFIRRHSGCEDSNMMLMGSIDDLLIT